ncbi:hypothetical protein BP00DRAFT_446392 [Aspergillus indologenus CBS 114.80]|uniref:Uncharacterized protein n=1 Tax=Aspergillus indologenus CBS 114.80 TaxID=1450541 RepID=A0A2V5J2V4_9EURO|nr:hypothetical protein BP00DRAFT_446392 [Aspergillus indologenus CBS 114.80]
MEKGLPKCEAACLRRDIFTLYRYADKARITPNDESKNRDLEETNKELDEHGLPGLCPETESDPGSDFDSIYDLDLKSISPEVERSPEVDHFHSPMAGKKRKVAADDDDTATLTGPDPDDPVPGIKPE